MIIAAGVNHNPYLSFICLSLRVSAFLFSTLPAFVAGFGTYYESQIFSKLGPSLQYYNRNEARRTMANLSATSFRSEADVLSRNQGLLSEVSYAKRMEVKKKLKEIGPDNVLEMNKDDHIEYNFDVDTQGFGSIVMEDGVARINSVLSEENSNAMSEYVDKLLIDTRTAVDDGIFPQAALFGNVFGKEFRWDLLLPIEASEVVVNCICEVLHEGSPISTAIESILGKDAELYELSTMISDPGSQAQPLHPDIKYQDTLHPLLTCFIALQDIDSQMGPTVFMKKSATKEYHKDLHDRHLDKDAKGLVAKSYNELGTLDKGDCSMYSAMTLHCGSANKSDKRRRLFYFSFINKALFQEEGGRNFVSIRPEIKERNLSLRDIQEMIQTLQAKQ